MSRIWLNSDPSDIAPLSGSLKVASLSQTTGVAPGIVSNVNTVAGPTSGVQHTDSTTAGVNGGALAWLTPPLNAGAITAPPLFSMWGRESNSNKNASTVLHVDLCAADGSYVATVQDHIGDQMSHEWTTAVAFQQMTLNGAYFTATAIAAGQRLRFSLWIRDAESQQDKGKMAAGGSVQIFYGGPASAQGDAWVEFDQDTITAV